MRARDHRCPVAATVGATLASRWSKATVQRDDQHHSGNKSPLRIRRRSCRFAEAAP